MMDPRYRSKIRRWQVCAGSNCARVLGLGEEELLGLTYRLAETARSVDPSIELVLGVSQPWGEYMSTDDYTHSPFIFADTLIRSGLNNLAALDIELVMGVELLGEDLFLCNAFSFGHAGVGVGDQRERRVAQSKFPGQDRFGVPGHAHQSPALRGEPL